MSHPVYVMTQKRPQEKFFYQSFIGEPLDVDLYENCKEHLRQFFVLKNMPFDTLTFDVHEFRRHCKDNQYSAAHTYQAFKSVIHRHGLFATNSPQTQSDVTVGKLYQLGGKLNSNQALSELNQYLLSELGKLEKLSPQNLHQSSYQC